MAKVRFHLEPDARTKREGRALARMLRSLTRPTRTMRRQVGDAVREGFLENFRRQRSGAGPWRPLAEATVMDRMRQGYPGRRPILQRTRSYRNSFINRSDPDHAEDFDTFGSGWEGEWGSEDVKMGTHEHGGSRMWGGTPVRIPARPVTILDRRAADRIGDVLDRLYRTMEPD